MSKQIKKNLDSLEMQHSAVFRLAPENWILIKTELEVASQVEMCGGISSSFQVVMV